MRPLLLTLGDYRNLTLNGTKRLSYLTRLFPSMFNEKLCEQLLQHICKMLENSITANKGKNFLAIAKTGDNEQKVATILGIFHQIPAATSKFIDTLCRLILQTEKSLMIEPSCPFREPLVKFLLRFPSETIDLLINDNNIKDQQTNRFVIYLLKHASGLTFRTVMQTKTNRLIQLILCNPFDGIATIQRFVYKFTFSYIYFENFKFYLGILMDFEFYSQVILASHEDRYEAQHQAVVIIATLIEFDENWIAGQSELIGALKSIWQTDLYKVNLLKLFYFSLHTNLLKWFFLNIFSDM